jgi:hypothetical protein
MYNSIILSSCLFGSIYLFSNSLESLNKILLKNYKIPYNLIVMNSFIVVMSGSIFVYSFVYSFYFFNIVRF